jgi:Fic family protein
MFNPRFRITSHLLKLFEGIASFSAIVMVSRVKASIKNAVERDVLVRSVHSSTWIEGNLLSLAQVRAMSQGEEVNAQEKQKREVANCINAMRWILKNKGKQVSENLVLGLHAKMTKDLLPRAICGKYRNVQNFIVNAKNQVIFTPPVPRKVPILMRELMSWTKTIEEHPIIRSAIFHHQFVAIHSFVDGNGRVARAASQWLLWEKGFDSIYTLGLDEFFAQDRAKYYEMIQQTHDMDGDYTYWVEYVAQGLARSMEMASQQIKEVSVRSKGLVITPKQEELLDLLGKKGTLGSVQIGQAMKINRARVNQLIVPLIRAGIIQKEGAARSVRYRLVQNKF